jgi:hypothetical protein
MKKLVVAALALCLTAAVSGSANAAPKNPQHGQAPSALMSAEHRAKIQEEIHLQEARAKELEALVARDRQARHDVEVNWGILERHAREATARAREFRDAANAVAGKARADLLQFATELETYAKHDEDNAAYQHEIAERLNKTIALEESARQWHVNMVQRLKDYLAANGG